MTFGDFGKCLGIRASATGSTRDFVYFRISAEGVHRNVQRAGDVVHSIKMYVLDSFKGWGVCPSRTQQIRPGIGLWVRVSRTFVRFGESDSDFCPTRTFRNRIRVESDLRGAGRRSDSVGLCPILKVRLGLGVRLGPSESDPSGIGPCAEPTALGRTFGSESDFVVSDSDSTPSA